MSASDLLCLFDRLPTEVSERSAFESRKGLTFHAGAYVPGGVVGVSRTCSSFPKEIQAFCRYVRQLCRQLRFSSFTVLVN